VYTIERTYVESGYYSVATSLNSMLLPVREIAFAKRNNRGGCGIMSVSVSVRA
jgi:hypothetical protein